MTETKVCEEEAKELDETEQDGRDKRQSWGRTVKVRVTSAFISITYKKNWDEQREVYENVCDGMKGWMVEEY